jgi:hypothetical protein
VGSRQRCSRHDKHANRGVPPRDATLRGFDASALSAVEQDRLREAADALLFARDLDDGDVQWALAEVAVLADELIDAAHWTPRRARQLLDDIWACGPYPATDIAAAA